MRDLLIYIQFTYSVSFTQKVGIFPKLLEIEQNVSFEICFVWMRTLYSSGRDLKIMLISL